MSKSGKELKKLLGRAAGLNDSDADEDEEEDVVLIFILFKAQYSILLCVRMVFFV